MSTFTPSSASASSQQTGFEASKAIDTYSGGARWASAATGVPQTLTRDEGSAKVATWYEVSPGDFTGGTSQDPTAWTLQASNDATFATGVVTLDTRSGVSFGGKALAYTFTNSTAFRYYRLNITGCASATVSVSEFTLGDGTPPSWLFGRRYIYSLVSGTFTLGVDFTPAVNGTITHLCYPHDSGNGTVKLYLSTTSGTVLASATDTQTGKPAASLIPVALGTPLAVTAGTTYRLAAYIPDNGWTVAGDPAVAVTDGDLTYVAGSARYATVDTNNPGNAGGARYSVSAVFVRSGTTPTPVSVSAPALGVVEAAPAPTVTAGAKVTVAAPALGMVEAVPAPTVSAGTGVSVAAPTLGVTTAVPAPSVVMGGPVNVAAPVLGVTVAAPAPTVLAGGSVLVDAPALGVATAVPAPVVSTSSTWTPGDTLLLSARSPVYAALASFEAYTPPTDVLVLSAPVACEATLRIHPVPVPVPAGISDRPIVARRHLMSPKTEANPRKMGDPLRSRAAGTDGYVYPIEENDLGRLRVFASGIDITYLAGAPTTVSEWSFAKPFGPQAASFTVPLPEWNYPGPYGNMPIFWGDAPIEICLEDSFGTLHHLWEGYTGEESDTAAPGQTGVTWNCEGTFQQAAHWLMDPPAVMDERDYGHVIADALNSVPNRRWAKIKRFTTGKTTTDRGDSAQSVLAYVADLLGKVFDDNGNQLGLHRVGPYAYQLAWNNTVVDPDWSFTKGSPGFNMTLARPHNARRDMVFGRGIAPDGGFWMNRKFPGLASASPPVYPMASAGTNISVGTRDSDTVTGNGVTTWQRRMRELGYPVTVDGVMNSADTKWVTRIQGDRGITVDGSLGPQTWSATWEGGAHLPETTTVRLPLDSKPNAREFDRDASGAIVRPNPLFDKQKILHATPEVDFGTNIRKSTATPMAGLIRNREASPGYVGSLTVTGVDPKEAGSSRFFINEGDNILIDGHHNGIVVQVSDVTHTPTTTRMTVDSGARGQAVVDAVLTRRRDLRRSPSGKSTRVTDRGTLNASQLGQYESESPAGKYSRTAINGDAGLWTVRCIYVAEQGLARFRLTSSPAAEIVTLICGKRITANQVAAIAPNPLSSSDGWYDAEKELTEKFGLVNVAGTPDNPGGYYPREKTGENAGPLTGVQAAGNLSMKSQRGGFFWVAVFTSRSTFVEGEFEPEVSTA